jgi:putative DNA primase/helicase
MNAAINPIDFASAQPKREAGELEPTIYAPGKARPFFKCTDTGNAERLVAKFGDSFRFIVEWAKWAVWDGRRWKVETSVAMQNFAKLTARGIYREAEKAIDPGTSKALADWAKRSEARDRRAAMIACAQSEPGVALHFADFDKDPFLLNVKNGTIDLRTGERRDHRREDLITRLVPIDYDATATAPLWETFLAEVLPDAEVRTFVQRFVGYCLTGDVSERILVLLKGSGKNGKSVFLRVCRTVLGEYATVAAPELLMVKRNDTHPTEIADLYGMRFVVCSEVKAGRAFDEQRIKELTGNEGAIKARRMSEDFWSFVPMFKLAIAANHEPRVHDETDSIWDRVREVPFTVRIPDEKVDKHLFEKLSPELPGILAWAVRGCLEWRKNGLASPAAVKRATEAYRESEDVVGRFIADRCAFDPAFFATTKALTDAAREWCESNAEREIGRKVLVERLKSQGDAARNGRRGPADGRAYAFCRPMKSSPARHRVTG